MIKHTGGSAYFRAYAENLSRVHLVEMIDAHRQAHTPRRLSIVGPCHTFEQWLAVQAERKALQQRPVAETDAV